MALIASWPVAVALLNYFDYQRSLDHIHKHNNENMLSLHKLNSGIIACITKECFVTSNDVTSYFLYLRVLLVRWPAMDLLWMFWESIDNTMTCSVVAKVTNYVMLGGDWVVTIIKIRENKDLCVRPTQRGRPVIILQVFAPPSASSPGVWGLYQKPSSKSSLSSSRSSSLSLFWGSKSWKIIWVLYHYKWCEVLFHTWS